MLLAGGLLCQPAAAPHKHNLLHFREWDDGVGIVLVDVVHQLGGGHPAHAGVRRGQQKGDVRERAVVLQTAHAPGGQGVSQGFLQGIAHDFVHELREENELRVGQGQCGGDVALYPEFERLTVRPGNGDDRTSPLLLQLCCFCWGFVRRLCVCVGVRNASTAPELPLACVCACCACCARMCRNLSNILIMRFSLFVVGGGGSHGGGSGCGGGGSGGGGGGAAAAAAAAAGGKRV